MVGAYRAHLLKSHPTPWQVRILLGMLHQSPWCYYPLTLQYLAPEFLELQNGRAGLSAPHAAAVCTEHGMAGCKLCDGSVERAVHHMLASAAVMRNAGLPQPPAHMRVVVAPMEALPLGSQAELDEQPPASESSGMTEDEGECLEQDAAAAGDPSSTLAQPRGLGGRQGDGDDAASTSSSGACSVISISSSSSPSRSSRMAAPALGANASGAESSGAGAAGAAPSSPQRRRGRGGARGAAAAPDCRCGVCELAIARHVMSCTCGAQFHADCLACLFEMQGVAAAEAALGAAPAGPVGWRAPFSCGRCPSCSQRLEWLELLLGMRSYADTAAQPRTRRWVGAAAALWESGRGLAFGCGAAGTAALWPLAACIPLCLPHPCALPPMHAHGMLPGWLACRKAGVPRKAKRSKGGTQAEAAEADPQRPGARQKRTGTRKPRRRQQHDEQGRSAGEEVAAAQQAPRARRQGRRAQSNMEEPPPGSACQPRSSLEEQPAQQQHSQAPKPQPRPRRRQQPAGPTAAAAAAPPASILQGSGQAGAGRSSPPLSSPSGACSAGATGDSPPLPSLRARLQQRRTGIAAAATSTAAAAHQHPPLPLPLPTVQHASPLILEQLGFSIVGDTAPSTRQRQPRPAPPPVIVIDSD